MVGDDDRQQPEDSEHGGAHRTPESPPEQPGPLGGASFLLVAILALLVLAMPVAWVTGAILVLSDVLGAVALGVLWVIWGLIVVTFVLVVVGMWRRAA